jgi:DNA-directed RNA polymerase subunit beta
VYGRAKAYESIIKNEAIVGPKLPESFNVLVKELQGLGLRVDLLDESEDAVIDAEVIIATSGPADKTVPAQIVFDDEELETILDEADELGDMEDGISIQDIDEIEEIKEEA